MHEFVGLQQVDHAGKSVLADPNVAVDDPDDVAERPCLTVSVAHVADFGIGSEIVPAALKNNVFVFDKDLGIVVWEVAKKLFKHWKGGVVASRDTEANV